MSNFFPGTEKPVVVKFANDIEVLKVEYPLSYHLLVRCRKEQEAGKPARRDDEAGSLRRLLDHDFPERDESYDRLHQSDASVPRLRRWRCAMDAWLLSDRARLIGRRLDIALKVLVVCAALYFFIRIAWAFLPGEAVERVLGGVR